MPKLEEIAVRFKDVVVDGIPSVELVLEVSDEAQNLQEPTPAMWFGIYLTHLFNSGKLMEQTQNYVLTGQYLKD